MATRVGFAQVERNHMSGGEAEARIHAQLPVDQVVMGKVIENGRFAKYDYATGKVNLAETGEWEMIYNEQVYYDERKQNNKDFAMVAKNYTGGVGSFRQGTYDGGEIVPRLMAVELGDIWTTNALDIVDGDHPDGMTLAEINALTDSAVTTITIPAVGTELYVNPKNGYLTTAKDASYVGPVMQVVKVYDLADGQDAVKVMRIK